MVKNNSKRKLHEVESEFNNESQEELADGNIKAFERSKQIKKYAYITSGSFLGVLLTGSVLALTGAFGEKGYVTNYWNRVFNPIPMTQEELQLTLQEKDQKFIAYQDSLRKVVLDSLDSVKRNLAVKEKSKLDSVKYLGLQTGLEKGVERGIREGKQLGKKEAEAELSQRVIQLAQELEKAKTAKPQETQSVSHIEYITIDKIPEGVNLAKVPQFTELNNGNILIEYVNNGQINDEAIVKHKKAYSRLQKGILSLQSALQDSDYINELTKFYKQTADAPDIILVEKPQDRKVPVKLGYDRGTASWRLSSSEALKDSLEFYVKKEYLNNQGDLK